MKTLKFKNDLVPLILNGTKTVTWRLFDDKDLTVGDEVSFLNADTKKEFARAHVLKVRIKKLGDVDEKDFEEGHERYIDQKDMLEHFRAYYGGLVSLDSSLKVVKFEISEGTQGN